MTNVRWVWCISGAHVNNLAACYPGDDYVDWLSFDQYNNHVTSQSWDALSTPAYNALCALNAKRSYAGAGTVMTNKPILVGEFASVEYGPGDKATWITNTFAHIATAQPRITAVVWFNGMDQLTNTLAYLIETSAGAQKAFADAVATPPYSL